MDNSVIAYLLAEILAERKGTTAEGELAKAEKFAEARLLSSETSEGKKFEEMLLKEDIDEIYKAYPTTDPKTGRSLGKCSKDKSRIKTLLQKRSKESILLAIDQYIRDCQNNDVYMKNFCTLLNNLPEPEVEEPLFPTKVPTDSDYR